MKYNFPTKYIAEDEPEEVEKEISKKRDDEEI
jgi:hypothetical protein